MTYEKLEAQINGLLAEALPLRELDDDDPAVEPLAGIVDQINALRKKQALLARNPPADDESASGEREQLEQRARDAGITFSPRISDAKLLERIEEVSK